jgi:hypothetical protein
MSVVNHKLQHIHCEGDTGSFFYTFNVYFLFLVGGGI